IRPGSAGMADADNRAEGRRSGQSRERWVRAMSRVRVVKTPAEPVQTEIVEDEIVDETKISQTGPEDDGADHSEQPARARPRIRGSRVIAYGLLPGLALLLAAAAGFLKWQDASLRDAQAARTESIQAATDGTIALLSYRADTVQKDLDAARGRLTGTFLNAYTSLTHEVVIPGAKQKQ